MFLTVLVALALLVAHRTRRQRRTTRLPPVPPTVQAAPKKPNLATLIDQAVDDDLDVRIDATEAIRANGKRGVTWLIARFRSKDPKTRLRVARALERLREDAEFAVPALAEVLRTDPDTNVRLAVLRALKAIGRNAQEAVPALISVLEKEDDAFVINCADLCGHGRWNYRYVVGQMLMYSTTVGIEVKTATTAPTRSPWARPRRKPSAGPSMASTPPITASEPAWPRASASRGSYGA